MRYYTIVKDDGIGYVCASPDGKTGMILRRFMTVSIMIMKHFNGKLPGLAEEVDLEKVKKISPIPHPRYDVIAVENISENHIIYSRHANKILGDGESLKIHSDVAESVECYPELAIVISRNADHVKSENARDYIFGYTIINNVRANGNVNDMFIRSSMDDSSAMGPCIVSADEFSAFPPNLEVKCKVNGKLRMSYNTEELAFSFGEIIEELSSKIVLEAGTIISLGAIKGSEKVKPGDIVECEIENIGKLKNIIAE